MEIVWSPRAEADFLRDIAFLEENYGRKVAADYMAQVMNTLEKITNEFVAYQLVDETKNIRRCKINKHKHLYYRPFEDRVELVAFFGSKQNPDNLNL
ncbi:MAG: type II toxin-antitoxin system RelE/ParE family toxin [Cytophagales bacterium]|jgi:plasmid stabilization system protein ParE|nr:type II toxin-antitoxin system RelE/ParE family toxin [Cytophagales bacterium]